VEATVRGALGARASSGPWSVSVVSFGDKWSVTLDGPGDQLRGLSFVTDPSQLKDAIRGAIGEDREGAAPGAAPAATPPPSTEARDSHVCGHCGRTVVVVYERMAEEAKELAPIACPHCWKIDHIEIGAWAAAGRDYRSEKA
jgi:DNA-directed RNA polymerase subunit RPC12/RpoP